MKTVLTPSANENHLTESSGDKVDIVSVFGFYINNEIRRNTVWCVTVESRVQLFKHPASLHWMIHFLILLHVFVSDAAMTEPMEQLTQLCMQTHMSFGSKHSSVLGQFTDI